MARAILERELKGGPNSADRALFAVADRSDDADIRRLLRENPMAGEISLTLEREPDYFADVDLPGETKQTIVARKGGRIVCMGSCSTRERFVNEVPCQVGYLGGLRLDASQTGRFDIIRRGYQFFREIQSEKPADFYFTSIAADNARARQVLESAVPGMPLYEFVGEFVTVVVPVVGTFERNQLGESISDNQKSGLEFDRKHIESLNNSNRQLQFAPYWNVDSMKALERLGLHPQDVCDVREGDRILASGALWDQRNFKQVVIRKYSSRLRLARPIFNIASCFGGSRLPAVGEQLANGYVSHLALASDQSAHLVSLLRRLSSLGARRGLKYLTLGFDARDPRLGIVRSRFHCREYHSRLYVVSWSDLGRSARELGQQLVAPEVALL